LLAGQGQKWHAILPPHRFLIVHFSEIFSTIGGASGISARVTMAETNGELNGVKEEIPLKRAEGLILVMDTPKGPPK
jgi:hypothetical protein